ncbi:hypothetical protein J2S42_007931 [Catenuloplanes indicus]|uniref:Uncharacterized protein n=1 Tax=Catenuloplanes indicus TaxID=137267 RepID=A0AAE3W8K6_9ACTN|nr:hypothetical protein [Catenuloplanes indicus]
MIRTRRVYAYASWRRTRDHDAYVRASAVCAASSARW